MYKEIACCRICGNEHLEPALNLGAQHLTGIFPGTGDPEPARGPLELVKCAGPREEDVCGLLQLRHSFKADVIYGKHYGYRSGLNAWIAGHLRNKARCIRQMVSLKPEDLIVDIGSNDGTLLNAYPENQYRLVGVDPTANKFRTFYHQDIHVIPDFFSADKLRLLAGPQKAKAVTSIAMFYDLDDPLAFVRQIEEILDDDGIWLFEQSYMPAMLQRNAYDTVCHEHLTYYSLRQIVWLLARAGLKIVDIDFNGLNGGSFAVSAAKQCSSYPECGVLVRKLLQMEKMFGLATMRPYHEFARRVENHRETVQSLFASLKARGDLVVGLGASTKGNVLLQYCGLTSKDLPFIADINPDKYGCRTPGTNIPIVPEESIARIRPDVLFVLPWHLKHTFINREWGHACRPRLIFPLPELSGQCRGEEILEKVYKV